MARPEQGLREIVGPVILSADPGRSKGVSMHSTAHMCHAVRRHIDLWKRGTHAQWRACFEPDYVIEDPVGTGLRPMGSYREEWDNMHSNSLRLDMEAYRLIVGGSEIVADLRAVTHLGSMGRGPDSVHGSRHTLSYTGIYTIAETGLLSANRTFADPVSEDLWRAFYPTLPAPSERDPFPHTEGGLRQAVEDQIYFWNEGAQGSWRERFSGDAKIEDPVGSGIRLLSEDATLWDLGHRSKERVRMGCHRSIACGNEVLAHMVRAHETESGILEAVSTTEMFSFDAEGFIRSWRVFRDGR